MIFSEFSIHLFSIRFFLFSFNQSRWFSYTQRNASKKRWIKKFSLRRKALLWLPTLLITCLLSWYKVFFLAIFFCMENIIISSFFLICICVREKLFQLFAWKTTFHLQVNIYFLYSTQVYNQCLSCKISLLLMRKHKRTPKNIFSWRCENSIIVFSVTVCCCG